jgi:S1-C subfamily serine protease
MPIRVVCPHCDCEFKVADELEGKKVRCRECQKPVPVGAAKSKRADDEEDEREERVQAKPSKAAPTAVRRSRADDEVDRPSRSVRRRDDDEEDERPSRNVRRRADEEDDDDDRPAPSKSKKKSTSKGVLIAAIGGGVVLVGGLVAAVVYLATRDSDKTADNTPVAPPAGFPGGGKGPPQGGMMGGGQAGGMMMGGGPQGGMMGGGQAGGMMGGGKAGGPKIDGMDVGPIERGIGVGPAGPRAGGVIQLTDKVLKQIKASTVYFRVKAKEKDVFGAQGSGFLAFEPGIVLTNAHVVDMKEPGSTEPESIEVFIHSGTPQEKQLKGKVLGVDRRADLAVVRIDPKDLPPPLVVERSSGLVLTQPIYVCGFPLGKELASEVTIVQGAVSNLHKDPSQRVRKVQLASDMQPGNSGGPVVNEQGKVVGVSVAGIPGTRINFAVPAEHVHVIVNGQLAHQHVGQSYLSGGDVHVPLKFELVNPLDKIQHVDVEVWTGTDQAKYVPQPSPSFNAAPQSQPGDSEHKSYSFELKGELASGSIALPDLPKGKAYFWQPVLTYKDKARGEFRQWATGARYALDDPVDRRQLKLMHKNHPGNRNVNIKIREKFATLAIEGQEVELSIDMDADVTERGGAVDSAGKSPLSISVSRLSQNINIPEALVKDAKDRELSPETKRALNNVGFLDLRMLVTARGDVESPTVSVKGAPPDIRKELENLGESVLDSLQAVAVPLPNRTVSHLETWTAKRPISVVGVLRGFKVDMDVTYTFLGHRNRNGRDEALLEISGRMRRHDSIIKIGGQLEGRALVDMETGVISLAHADVQLELELPLPDHTAHARGAMEVTVTRELPR